MASLRRHIFIKSNCVYSLSFLLILEFLDLMCECGGKYILMLHCGGRQTSPIDGDSCFTIILEHLTNYLVRVDDGGE